MLAEVATSPGVEAILVRESNNPHDPNAISIWARKRDGEPEMIGYMDKLKAKRFSKMIDGGEAVKAVFTRGTGLDIDSYVPMVLAARSHVLSALLSA
ncbi:MAG: HIRAN domain-containing protein [Micrococcales bacterium]|nr:HIRAN domain-containing protein [Micrococcales bacterium]